MNITRALTEASDACRKSGAESPRLDAEVLLAHCLGRDRSWLLGFGEELIENDARIQFRELIHRRCRGEPVAYLTGSQEFFGLPFSVGPSVLVPRPETEGLVDLALDLGRTHGGRRFVDACTGSGNIAVAARLCGRFEEVAATELSSKALEVARANASRLKARVEFYSGNLLEPLLGTAWHGTTDVVCSNPPYVKREELDSLPREVQYEPPCALDGGAGGMEVVRPLVEQSLALLAPGGFLLVEIGEDQGPAALEAAEGTGFVSARVEKDLSGLDRYLVAGKGGMHGNAFGRN
ncbi:MAG: peptide chain release factor N(5)-glutamine methyltransferase [Planctomycetota bacterium]